MKRPILLLALFVLGGCVVVARPRPAPPPPPPPPPPAAAPALISEGQAIDIALRLARARGLAVDRVQHANLDGAGRWHVDVRGHGDRAKVLLDGRDGRLLRGKFKSKGDHGRDDWDD